MKLNGFFSCISISSKKNCDHLNFKQPQPFDNDKNKTASNHTISGVSLITHITSNTASILPSAIALMLMRDHIYSLRNEETTHFPHNYPTPTQSK